MILDTLKLIRDELRDYIQKCESIPNLEEIVILDNIAMAGESDGSGRNLGENIVISLINVQEEATLKNSPYYYIEKGRTVYRNPPVCLNLFILFSVLKKDYESALKLLSRVIEFFQWKKEFLFTVTSVENDVSRDVQVVPDLYTLDFDQMNHLWGVLGGKQVPFVLYRIRLVTLDAQKTKAEGTPVTDRGLELE